MFNPVRDHRLAFIKTSMKNALHRDSAMTVILIRVITHAANYRFASRQYIMHRLEINRHLRIMILYIINTHTHMEQFMHSVKQHDGDPENVRRVVTGNMKYIML
jgi:flagellar assembly factor FliW